MKYECNRRLHRAQFKFVKYQHNKMPVGLIFDLDKKKTFNITRRFFP